MVTIASFCRLLLLSFVCCHCRLFAYAVFFVAKAFDAVAVVAFAVAVAVAAVALFLLLLLLFAACWYHWPAAKRRK